MRNTKDYETLFRLFILCAATLLLKSGFYVVQANLYPRGYTLIPAAILLGCGSNVFTVTSTVYTNDLANRHAEITGGDKEKITSRFFGFTKGSSSVSMLVGNTLTSFVMNTFSAASQTKNPHELLFSRNETGVTPIRILNLRCEIRNWDNAEDFSGRPHILYHQEATRHYNSAALYYLMVGFAVTQFTAAVILWCGTRVGDMKTPAEIIEATRQRLVQPDDNEEQHVTRRLKGQIIATAKFYINHPTAILMVPFTIHYGLLHGFVLSQVTKDWITCIHGIESVGYGISVYAVGCIIGGFGCGILTECIPKWTLVLIDLTMEIVGIAVLWNYDKYSASWLLYLAIGLLGVVQESLRTLNATINSIYFSPDKRAAIAFMSTWFCFGKGIEFAISSHTCNTDSLILVISVAICTAIAYITLEVIRAKNIQ